MNYQDACSRWEELRADHWRTIRRAAGSWYTKNERMLREGAARRLRVMHARTWAAVAS